MAADLCTREEMDQVLAKLPQQPPFRFLDRIVELSQDHIVAERRFFEQEYFYKGHFPGDPVTPGVLLIETMAQAGLVALGIYLLECERPGVKMRTLFSDCAIDFVDVVRPGELVTVHAQKIFWRRNKLKSQVELKKENGTIAAHGVVSGLGVISF